MEEQTAMWPEDLAGNAPGNDGPDAELAIVLLAAGMPQSFIRTRCGFDSQRAVQAFCRDEDVRLAAAELANERARRLGRRASVCLEEILSTPQTDLRAHVLAIRTALEVSGDLKRDHSAPVKSVRELSVGELNQLIEATQNELESRVGRYRADGRLKGPTKPAETTS
jgi:hypothetical protein